MRRACGASCVVRRVSGRVDRGARRSELGVTMSGAGYSLHPVVLWAQTADVISLSVQLVEPKNHQLKTSNDTHIEFRATGRGAHGLADYGFRLDLYSDLHQVSY